MGQSRIFRVLKPVWGVADMALGGKVNVGVPCNAVVATVNHEKLSACEGWFRSARRWNSFSQRKTPIIPKRYRFFSLRFLLSMMIKDENKFEEELQNRNLATRAPFYSFPRRAKTRHAGSCGYDLVGINRKRQKVCSGESE